jgi:hypothetical protein
LFCVLCAAGAQAAQTGALALLVSQGDEGESRLVFVDPATGRIPDGGTRVAHLPGGMVRGALLPGHGAVVVADRLPGRDRSWGASLLRVDAGAVVELCDRVDHASRPLVTADGRVVVARGRAGAIARAGELRTDELTIEEIDASGTARVLWRGRGYQAHLAGTWNGEVIVYHVFAGGASLLAVPLDGGRARTVLPSLLPFARDFSVDAGELAFAERDEARADRWVVDVVDLSTGVRRRALGPASQILAPRFDRSHQLAVARDRDGVEVVRAIAPTGARAAWHYPPGRALPDVRVLDADGAVRATITAPARTRLEIVGFVGGAW